MSNLTNFAEEELRRAGWLDKGSMYDGMIGEAVLSMIRQFAEEGHSGMSASITISIFSKLARFEPLTPLTGEDDEWTEVYNSFEAFAITEPDDEAREIIDAINAPKRERLWQNKRCSHVFKDENGAYDSQGRVFREPSGACFTSRDSRVPITFPYTPTVEYVDLPAA